MRRIRVLAVDDHGLMIEAIRLALAGADDIDFSGTQSAALALLEMIRQQPDIVLLDIRMPDVDGFTVLETLRERYPETKVVMFSAIDDPEVADEALRRGAHAYLDKRIDPATLADTLRRIASGRAAPESPTERPNGELRLTGRERRLLSRLADGRSNAEIAAELFVSETTVKYHLTNLYRKLAVDGRAGAVRFWFEQGLLDTSAGDVESLV